MRVILFQPRFADLVSSGVKTQTIRKAARCKVGDALSLRRWTGKPYRSKQETIKNATCECVTRVIVEEHDLIFPDQPNSATSNEDMNSFARMDGFRDFVELVGWVERTHGIPFHGEVIQWSNTKRSGQSDGAIVEKESA